jgi:hypothetical protein
LTLLAILLQSCSGGGDKNLPKSEKEAVGKKSEPEARKEDPDDPRVSKNRLVEKIKKDSERLSSRAKDFADNREGRSFSIRFGGDFDFDIKKTDSVVTPYVGIVDYHIDWCCNGNKVGVQDLRVTYAYQEGTWVFKDVIRREGTLGAAQDEPKLAAKWVAIFRD